MASKTDVQKRQGQKGKNKDVYLHIFHYIKDNGAIGMKKVLREGKPNSPPEVK